MLFGFDQSADIEIQLEDAEKRKLVQIRPFTEDLSLPKHKVLYIYYDGESISGKVRVFLKKPGQKLEHQGIRIEFIGQIEVYYDRGNHTEFCSLTKHLAQPGDLTQNTDFRFEFTQVEKPFESYTGANVKLRYFLRVIIARRLSDIVREFDVLVHTLSTYPDGGSNIRMEVGIEDCLHIEFEYDKSRHMTYYEHVTFGNNALAVHGVFKPPLGLTTQPSKKIDTTRTLLIPLNLFANVL